MMGRNWFTADLHLGHANILKYCRRPFLTPEEMTRACIEPRARWKVSPTSLRRHDDGLIAAVNERVAADDTLWVLGDFSFYRRPHDPTYEARVRGFRRRIACRNVFLVAGNHDHDSAARHFTAVLGPSMIEVEGQEIYVAHEPRDNWDRQEQGAWHLYGHVHGRLARSDRAGHARRCDVGVDVWDYKPVRFEELSTWMAGRDPAPARRA
jgi:calcineurin-like phosphoesterase family protein